MENGRITLSLILAVSLAACGGDGDAGPTFGNPTPTPTPTPDPGFNNCSTSELQDFALAVINEWYLFPGLVSLGVNQSDHDTVQSYIDALVAPARAQSRDRFFTYITSISEENAFFNSGSSAGIGIRLSYDSVENRVFVIEAFENAPGFAQGMDRGTELLAVGETQSSLEDISTLMQQGGANAVIDRLGPTEAGVTRIFRIRDPNGSESTITISKAAYSLDPVSDRYGFSVIQDGGKQVGYVNLRTFINSAGPDLRAGFANFRSLGITEIIVDLRYNGGGLINIADLMGNLMAADRNNSVWSYRTLRASKSDGNLVSYIQSQQESIAATKIAFIGRDGTASASELVTNGFIPYLGGNMALVGTNTFGKPVGQYGFDLERCDARMRAVTFKTENADHQGEYYTGLASVVPNSCAASDDFSKQLGDPAEASIAAALGFLRGESCTPIAAGGQQTQSVRPKRALLQPRNPSAAQREVPGLF